MSRLRIRPIVGLLAGLCLAGPALAQEETTWAEIRSNLIGQRPVEDAGAVLALEAPWRAEDAALVPITVRLKALEGEPRRFKALILVVDENPSPLVGTIRFAEPRASFDLATRVRVNSYSYVRAIAETEDGRLLMTKAYVKAAGGCSAPASKDPAEAKAHLGEMRFRSFAGLGEAQVQVRHPNNSGLQMDQMTRLYTPAWYVENLTVRQGARPLFAFEGGISISEDPTFRFSFAGSGEPVAVEARDSEGRVFRRTFAADGS